MDKDITNLIERLQAFEERLEVTLEGLFASLSDSNYITVNGELHPLDGDQLTQDTQLVISAHDSVGRVLNTQVENFSQDSFFGFETFSVTLWPPDVPVVKIRIYPKSW